MVGGELSGNGDVLIDKVLPIEEAQAGALTFLSNPKYISHLYSTGASAVLINKDFEPENNGHPTLIKVDDVYSCFSILLERYTKNGHSDKVGIEEGAIVREGATHGKNVYIGGGAYVAKGCKLGNNVKIFPGVILGDNVEIGNNTIIHAGAKIYAECKIGNDCIIHSGAVIGSDGFGFAPQKDGSYMKMPQTGNVLVEDNVEIGANTTIDRATLKSTVIKKGAKLDNLIQIAHNVEIGENTVIAAQAGISGSTKIGTNCVIAGQVGIVGHLKIADNTRFGAKTGVNKSIATTGTDWMGIPALPYKESLQAMVISKKLPELYKQIQKLQQEVEELKQQNKISG